MADETCPDFNHVTAIVCEHRVYGDSKSIVDSASPSQWKNDRGSVDSSNALFDDYSFFYKDVLQGILRLTFTNSKKEDLAAWEVTFDIRDA